MTRSTTIGGERGAIIIHVAIALIALLCFLALVVDYGSMWVSRRQAQSAADAGALAGAISLVREGTTAMAKLSAAQFATRNPIWGQANSYDGTTGSNVSIDVSGTASGETSLPPCGTNKGCVRVDIFRNEPDRPERSGVVRGSALPTFFGHLFGLTQQGVRATATAWTATAESTECLKPWAVADKWSEHRPTTKPWAPTDTFDKWDIQGNTVTLYPDPRDVYVPPTTTDPGTGFTPAADNGLQLMLKRGSGNDPISAGWFQALDLPCSDGNSGADCYAENIANCTTQTYSIGDTLTVSTEPGNMVGPTDHGVNGSQQLQGLVEKDPDASWVKDDPSAPYVPGVPQPGHVVGGQGDNSPRIVPVALINIDDFLSTSPSGKSTVTIVNIMGFFIEGTCGGQVSFQLESYNSCSKNNGAVVGRLVKAIGLKPGSGTSTIGPQSSFLSVIQLVR